MHRRILSIILASALLGAGGTRCLYLDNSGTKDLPALLSLVGSKAYIFMDDSAGDATARSLLTYSADGSLQRVNWSGGPQNIRMAAVANNVIYALDNQNIDDVWISRDGGSNWEQVDLPSSNESEQFKQIADCGGKIVVAFATIKYNGSGTHPGYVSSDGGASWQAWQSTFSPMATGTGDIILDSLECNSDLVFITSSNSTAKVEWASTSDLNSWTSASSHPAGNSLYTSTATSGTGLIGLTCDGSCNSPGLNYSTNLGNGMAVSGTMPNSTGYYHATGVTEYANNGIFASPFLVSEANSGSQTCIVYRFSTGATAPSSTAKATLSCSDVGSLYSMPAMLAFDSNLLVSYRSSLGTQTGLLLSRDGGVSLEKVDLSSVWTDSGFIADIEDSY